MTAPPFSEPEGPHFSHDPEALDAFLGGATSGFSSRYHIEDRVLYRDRTDPIALALGGGAFLVRDDAAELGSALGAARANPVEVDSQLGTAVALQAVGLPAARWDFWARDPVEGRWRLEACAENWWVMPHLRG